MTLGARWLLWRGPPWGTQSGVDNFCRLRVPGVQVLGRAWPCAPFPLLPLRQWDPFCQPRTPAHTGETRGRAAAALLGGTSAWPTRVGPAADSPRFCAPRPGEGGAVTVGASRPGDAPERLRPARSSPRSDPSGPIGTDSGLEVRLASPRAAPYSLPNDGYGPHRPQVPESRRRRFQGDGNDACSAKRSPSVPATFTQVSAHAGGWHGAVNHAQTCQPGGVAPSRQSRVDVPDQPVWSRGLARGS